MGNPAFGAHILGYHGAGAATLASKVLNSNDIWVAFSFIAPLTAKSLDKVTVFVSAVAGTLDADDMRCDIFSDTAAGIPNATLANTTTVDATPTGAASVEFTFASPLALTANTRYWVVVQNDAAVPATNYFTLAWSGTGTTAEYTVSNATTWGWAKIESADAGSTWITAVCPVIAMRVHYSTDSSSAGLVITASNAVGTADAVYEAREQGAVFTVDANATIKIAGVGGYIRKTGTPAGNLRFRLYNDTTLLGTTAIVLEGQITTAKWHSAYFATPIEIAGGTALIRAVLGTTGGGDTSNYYRAYTHGIQNVAANLALGPFAGTFKQTYLNSTWADDAAQLPFIALILDSDSPFVAAGGGGCPLVGAGGLAG